MPASDSPPGAPGQMRARPQDPAGRPAGHAAALAVLAVTSVLALTCLSACGGSSSATTTASAPTTSAAGTPATSTTTPSVAPSTARAAASTSSSAAPTGATLAPGQLFAVMPCSAKARAILAHLAGVPVANVKQVHYTAPSGASSCRLTVTGKHTGHLVVELEFDTAPQAYYRLEREAVEDAQAFATSTTHTYPPPQALANVGLEADWFPGEQKAMTTDGKTLYSILITWPHVKMAREKALGAHIALALVGHTPKTITTSSTSA